MTAINRLFTPALNGERLDLALRSLAIRLEENRAEAFELVVCGGTALILTGLIQRTTQDVDVVALMRQGTLCSPEPLPPALLLSVREVAEDLNLPYDWSMTHDVSEGFAVVLKRLLRSIGYDTVAERL